MSVGRWLSRAAEYFQKNEPAAGPEVERKLEDLNRLRHDPDSTEVLSGYLLDRSKRVRDRAAAALAGQGKQPRNPAERCVFFISTRNWSGLQSLSALELIAAWAKKDSLSPGGFWTVYLIAALLALGPPAAEQLARFLDEHDGSMNSKIVVLWTLGLFGAEEQLPRLRAVYEQDRNQRMRLAVVQACRFLGQPGQELLVDLLGAEETDEVVRAAAGRGAAALGSSATADLVGLLKSKNGKVREHAALALFSSGDPEGLVALSSLRHKERDGRLRALISRLLIDMGGDGRDWSDLADTDRAAALIEPEQCIRRLQLRDEEQIVTVCTLALGNAADPRAARPLMDVAMAGMEDMLTAEAWMALSRLAGHEEGRRCLFSGLEHGELYSRFWAGLGLLMAGKAILDRL